LTRPDWTAQIILNELRKLASGEAYSATFLDRRAGVDRRPLRTRDTIGCAGTVDNVGQPYWRLIAIQLPIQPSDRVNVPEPLFPDNCPTAVSVMPPPAPTECKVPSGSTIPLPPRTMILPFLMVAGSEPVFGHPALVKIHRPSKFPLPVSGLTRGASGVSSRRLERKASRISPPATAAAFA
jgi:hypothetical protein